MRVLEHGGNRRAAGAVSIAPIINGQKINALRIVLGADIVVIAYHLAIAMKKKKINRSRVSGQKKSTPEHHPCFHLYPVILGADRRRGEVLPWIKERGLHRGVIKLFVCSCLLHVLP